MKKRKQEPAPTAIRLQNGLADPDVPKFTITQLMVVDLIMLSEGTVPDWIRQTAEFWLTSKPGDIPPNYQTYAQEAVANERKSA